jgi:arylsulfatase
MFSTEGGCRVPLVVKPTAEVASRARGSIVTDAFCTVMDIVPTILEYAGLGHPETYSGRPVMPLRGKSWKSFLDQLDRISRSSPIHDESYVAGFEVAGSGALRRGDWKITYVPKPKGPQRWELFNIKNDPGETNDLAESRPELMTEMLKLWEEYKVEVGVVGLAGEFPGLAGKQGAQQDTINDEMEDPYSWIKYIKRPEITPKELVGIVPV